MKETADQKIKSVNCDPQSRLGKLRKISLDAFDRFVESSDKLLEQLDQGAKFDDVEELIKENLESNAAYGARAQEFHNALEVAVHED